MSSPEPNQKQARSGTTAKAEREVRFAVVMYGGVSLAIYINGVAQELLNMVRATATAPTEDTKDKEDKKWEPLVKGKLPGAMEVYRKLGQYLGIRDKEKRREKLLRDSVSVTDPIRNRLVVDIISGTSAGGINGVFLAKALARDQGMKGLKKLWLTEGDLDKLLNDKHSMKGVSGFALKQPQESLLNSKRMYYKLLEALDRMDDPRQGRLESEWSPLVGELDLFITTTDIDGVPLPISLSDDVVYERRYKNVFHFRYTTAESTGTNRDDFVKENDPFLAFAARCTSSFPFAFEAMRLSDITDIAKAYPAEPHYSDKSITATTSEWDKFYSDYLRNGLFDLDLEARGQPAIGKISGQGDIKARLVAAKNELRESFRKRSFGDGGYLDNKPFSYATSMLSRRHADCAVDRKLLYVEPSPEHPDLTQPRVDPPDFAENVRAAALDLPREETIREDLDRVYERNELLDRVAILAKEVDADVIAAHEDRVKEKTTKEATAKEPKFEEQGLREMIKEYGVSYGAYHRLKIAELTNVLAELIARAAGHDPSSDAEDAIRELVRAWRRAYYHPLKPEERESNERKDPEGNDKETENAFLRNFDIRYHLRRLAFLNRRINALVDLDDDAARLLEAVCAHSADWPKKLTVRDLIDRHGQEFQDELNRLKRRETAPALKEARAAEETLRNRDPGPGKDLYDMMGELKIGWPDLRSILECEAGSRRNAKADGILREANRGPVLSKVATIISKALKLHESVDIVLEPNVNAGVAAARATLNHYNKKFLFYDLVTYPIQYGTGAGEASVVDVFRVSPEDAQTLMKEPANKSNGAKLAGRTLMSFGAFLDESWRRNDMLWGRLDGAERIIEGLLPDDDDLRKALIQEAHLGIITQELEEEKNSEAVVRLLRNALFHREEHDDHGAGLIAFIDRVVERNKSQLSDEQRQSLNVAQELDRHLSPETALKYISRSTNITGNMLSGLSDKYHLDPGKRFAAWMTTFGTILWNLVAAAVPENLFSWFFRHWLRVLYVFAVVLLLLGILNPAMRYAGWQLFGITIVLNLVVVGLRAYMHSKRPAGFLKAFAQAAAVLIPAALIGTGIVRLIELGFNFSLAPWIELSITAAAGLGASLLVFFRARPPTEKVQSAAKQIPAPAPSDANPS